MRLLWEQNKLTEFIDPRLASYDNDEVLRIVKVAMLCTSRTPTDRPPMSVVVSMMEGQFTAEIEMQLANKLGGDEDQPPDLMKVIAEIDLEFESQESHDQGYLLLGKGKKKLSSDSFSFIAESSRAGAERR